MESKVVEEKKCLFIVFSNSDRIKLLKELGELLEYIDDPSKFKKTNELITHLK